MSHEDIIKSLFKEGQPEKNVPAKALQGLGRVAELRRARELGWGVRRIAERFGIPARRVKRLLHRPDAEFFDFPVTGEFLDHTAPAIGIEFESIPIERNELRKFSRFRRGY